VNEDRGMLIADAQRDVRTVSLGGFVGQLVSSIVWFASAAVAAFVDPVVGFWALAVGGATIFPLTQALLRICGRPTALAPGIPWAAWRCRSRSPFLSPSPWPAQSR
jgi:hypothetical protein